MIDEGHSKIGTVVSGKLTVRIVFTAADTKANIFVISAGRRVKRIRILKCSIIVYYFYP